MPGPDGIARPTPRLARMSFRGRLALVLCLLGIAVLAAQAFVGPLRSATSCRTV